MQFNSIQELIAHCQDTLQNGTIRQLTQALEMFVSSGVIDATQVKSCKLKKDYQALLDTCVSGLQASLEETESNDSIDKTEIPQCPYEDFESIGVTINNVTVYGEYANRILEPLWLDGKLKGSYYLDGYLMPVSLTVEPEYEVIYRDKILSIDQYNELPQTYRDFLKKNDLVYYSQGRLRIADLETVDSTESYDWLDEETGIAYRHKTIKRPIYLTNPREIRRAGKVERPGYKTSNRVTIPQALFKTVYGDDGEVISKGLNYDAIESIDCPSFSTKRLRPQKKRASTLRKSKVKSKISWGTKFIPLASEPKIALGYKIPVSAFAASNDRTNDGISELTYYQPKKIDRKGRKTILTKVKRTVKVKPSLRLVLDKDRFVKIFDGNDLAFVIGYWSYDRKLKVLDWRLFEDSLPGSWSIFLNRIYDRIVQDIAAKHNKQVAIEIASHDAEMHATGAKALRDKSKAQRNKLKKLARSWFFNGGYNHNVVMKGIKDKLQNDKTLSENKRQQLNNQIIGYYLRYVEGKKSPRIKGEIKQPF